MAKPERSENHLLYEGRRFIRGQNDSKEKMQHVFRVLYGDDAGVEMWWPKAKAQHHAGARIGGVYDMRDGLPDSWTAVYVGEVEEGERLRLQALDRDALIRKQESSQRTSPELEDAIDAIVRARSAVTPSRRKIWDMWLLQEIASRRVKL